MHSFELINRLFFVSVRLCWTRHRDGMVNPLWAGGREPWMIQRPQSWTTALGHTRDQRAVTELLSGGLKLLVGY